MAGKGDKDTRTSSFEQRRINHERIFGKKGIPAIIDKPKQETKNDTDRPPKKRL